MSVKILHLSDLHFCSKSIKSELQDIISELEEILNRFDVHSFDFTYHNNNLKEKITAIVRDHDPNIIVVTGDITTFGDLSSFNEAGDFLDKLRHYGTEDPRKIICTPGNHDVLCSLLQALISKDFKFSRWISWLSKIIKSPKDHPLYEYFEKIRLINNNAPRIITKLKDILHEGGKINAQKNDPLVNYEHLLNEYDVSDAIDNSIYLNESCKVGIIPYRSISLEKFWLNIGVSSLERYDFTEDRKFKKFTDKDLKIAILHHNPISSPLTKNGRLVNAYNSMPDSSTFVNKMQREGFDMLLYGHQHEFNCCEMDFIPNNPSHLYLAGSQSSLSDKGAGFNILTLKSRYYGELKQYTINVNTGTISKGEEIPLHFENKRINDPKTLSTKQEIRHYVYEGDDEDIIWKSILKTQKTQGDVVFLVGARQGEIIQESNLVRDAIKDLTNDKIRVNILLSDPELYEIISGKNFELPESFIKKISEYPDLIEKIDDGNVQLPSKLQNKLEQIWDDSESYNWRDQSEKVKEVLERLKGIHKNLENKELLTVKLSHTLIPIGARCHMQTNGVEIEEETINQNINGTIVLRLLGVGKFGDTKRPLIKLEKRYNKTMYTFYGDYIIKLWNSAKQVDLDSS